MKDLVAENILRKYSFRGLARTQIGCWPYNYKKKTRSLSRRPEQLASSRGVLAKRPMFQTYDWWTAMALAPRQTPNCPPYHAVQNQKHYSDKCAWTASSRRWSLPQLTRGEAIAISTVCEDATHNSITNYRVFYQEQSETRTSCPRAPWRPQTSTRLCQGPPDSLDRLFCASDILQSDRIIN